MPLHYILVPAILFVHAILYKCFWKKETYGKRLFRSAVLAVVLVSVLTMIIIILPYRMEGDFSSPEGDMTMLMVVFLLASFVFVSVIYTVIVLFYYMFTYKKKT